MEKNRLDLHGTRHIDVKRKVIRFIEDNWDQTKGLKIITGHSHKMVNLVETVLKEYRLDYRIGDMFGIKNGTIKIL